MSKSKKKSQTKTNKLNLSLQNLHANYTNKRDKNKKDS